MRYVVAREFYEVLISYEFFSMMVLKVARKSIGERVNIDYFAFVMNSRIVVHKSHHASE